MTFLFQTCHLKISANVNLWWHLTQTLMQQAFRSFLMWTLHCFAASPRRAPNLEVWSEAPFDNGSEIPMLNFCQWINIQEQDFNPKTKWVKDWNSEQGTQPWLREGLFKVSLVSGLPCCTALGVPLTLYFMWLVPLKLQVQCPAEHPGWKYNCCLMS